MGSASVVLLDNTMMQETVYTKTTISTDKKSIKLSHKKLYHQVSSSLVKNLQELLVAFNLCFKTRYVKNNATS